MDFGLHGKCAVVTGGGSGLGAAIAEALAAEGMQILLLARNAARLEKTASRIGQRYGHAPYIHSVDLTAVDEIEVACKRAIELLPTIDLLVNCAGATKRGEFFSLTEEDWHIGFSVKFFGAVRMSRGLWPQLKKSKGAIVNIVGLGSRMPGGDFTIGGSVNSALLNFTKALSEIGVQDSVRVNAVNPGFFHTDRLEHSLRAVAEQSGVAVAQASDLLLKKLGVSRFGDASEVGTLVAFLASDQARYLNGAAVEIDGGVRRNI